LISFLGLFMALTSRSDTQETSHIFMWDEWTFTLKVATFDGAFFMSNDVEEHKNFCWGLCNIFLLLVCWQFTKWTFWWQFLFRLSSNMKTSVCVCNFFHAYIDEHWLVPQKMSPSSLFRSPCKRVWSDDE
jgi:hypothetical protein